MPRTCTICTHTERAAIDTALVAKLPLRNIAERYGLSPPALHRHKGEHLPASLTKAQEAEEATQADDLLTQVRTLQTRTLAILAKAEAAGRLGTAVMAIREARGNLELLAKLLGELDERPTVNLVVAPQWLELRGRILAALSAYPQARMAIVEALGDAG